MAWLLAAGFAALASTGCNFGEADTGSAEVSGIVDQDLEVRYDEVRAIHDEVMPQRGDLIRLERDVRDAELDEDIAAFAKTRLTRADDAMMSWMHTDRSLTSLADSLDRAGIHRFLDEREQEIERVADSMRVAIDYAQQVLAQ